MPDLSLAPRSVERPADAGHTLVGVLDSAAPARVDGGGALQLDGQQWSIDWFVGADDRWHLPAKEPAVRQRRIGAGPVVETSVRIPSGDAIQRIYAANVAGEQVMVLEFENASPVPFALALAIRPQNLDGQPSRRLSAELHDGKTPSSPVFITVGEAPTVGADVGEGPTTHISLPRTPNHFGVGADHDVLDTLLAGGDLVGSSVSGDGPTAVALYPVPHRTTIRFVVGTLVDPASVPAADDVAQGWTTILERGGRFEFPDNGVSQQALASRTRLMMAAAKLPGRITEFEPGAGRILEGLALSGAVAEVLGALGAFAGSFPTKLTSSPADAAAILSGVGRAARLADDEPMAAEMLAPAAQLTRLIEKSGDDAAIAEAFLGLARLLITAGQPEPAMDLTKRSASLHAEARPDIPTSIDRLGEFAQEASPSGSFGSDDPVRAATYWLGARSLLIDDRPGALDLLPSFPSAWRGGNVEVHGAATSHGIASFGIRWHGYRPALLWDVEADDEVIIRCPGLDADWFTMEPKGEALLAGSTEGLEAVPEAGDSFQ